MDNRIGIFTGLSTVAKASLVALVMSTTATNAKNTLTKKWETCTVFEGDERHAISAFSITDGGGVITHVCNSPEKECMKIIETIKANCKTIIKNTSE